MFSLPVIPLREWERALRDGRVNGGSNSGSSGAGLRWEKWVSGNKSVLAAVPCREIFQQLWRAECRSRVPDKERGERREENGERREERGERERSLHTWACVHT